MGDQWAISLFFVSVTHFSPPFSSPLHSSTLPCSLSVYLPSLSTSPISCTLSLLLSVLFLSLFYRALFPLSPSSHRGLIYFHHWVKRGAFVCHQQWSHGTMSGVMAIVPNLQSLLPSLTRKTCVLRMNCMCVGRTLFVCLHPYLFLSLFLS